jgi:uncharacterized membrane protein
MTELSNMKKDSTPIVLYNRIMFVLSIIGIVIAAYVTQSFIRQSPIVCVNTGCELVRKHPSSYLWGIPVPAVGLVGYILMALFAFLRTTSEENTKKFLKGILAVSTFGVLFVSWFTYTELFVIKGICTWCAISAINILVIFLLALKSHKLQTKVF